MMDYCIILCRLPYQSLLEDLKEEAEPGELTGDVDPAVWGEVAQQTDPHRGVDGGQQGLHQEDEVQGELESPHRAEDRPHGESLIPRNFLIDNLELLHSGQHWLVAGDCRDSEKAVELLWSYFDNTTPHKTISSYVSKNIL